MNQIKAIIFDVDGVLLDSVPYHFKAWKKLFNEQGVDFTFEDYLTKVNGLPRSAGIRNILPDLSEDKLKELAEKKQGYFLLAVRQKPPRPLEGVINFLELMEKHKLLLAAASSSKNSPQLLDQSKLSQYMDTIISGNDFTKPKPDPEIFLVTAQRLKVEPKSCVVVEDAVFGIYSAKAANMHTIGLLTSQDQEILKVADITIPSLKDHLLLADFFY